MRSSAVSRRKFLNRAVAAAATISLVPRHVLGQGLLAPSDMIKRASWRH